MWDSFRLGTKYFLKDIPLYYLKISFECVLDVEKTLDKRCVLKLGFVYNRDYYVAFATILGSLGFFRKQIVTVEDLCSRG